MALRPSATTNSTKSIASRIPHPQATQRSTVAPKASPRAATSMDTASKSENATPKLVNPATKIVITRREITLCPCILPKLSSFAGSACGVNGRDGRFESPDAVALPVAPFVDGCDSAVTIKQDHVTAEVHISLGFTRHARFTIFWIHVARWRVRCPGQDRR